MPDHGGTLRPMSDVRLTLGSWAAAFAALAWVIGGGALAYLFYGDSSTMAATESRSLVVGLLGLVMLPMSLVALVLSIIALRRPRVARTGTVASVAALVLAIGGLLAGPGIAALALLFVAIAGAAVVH